MDTLEEFWNQSESIGSQQSHAGNVQLVGAAMAELFSAMDTEFLGDEHYLTIDALAELIRVIFWELRHDGETFDDVKNRLCWNIAHWDSPRWFSISEINPS